MNDLGQIITIAGNLGGAVIVALGVVLVLYKGIEKFAEVQDRTLTAFREELKSERDGSERRHAQVIALIEKTHDEKMGAHAETSRRIDQVMTVMGNLKHA